MLIGVVILVAGALGFFFYPTPSQAAFKVVKLNYLTSKGGEYVRIQNSGSKTVDLKGWRVYNQKGRVFTFSKHLKIKASEKLTLYTKKGTCKYSGTSKKIYFQKSKAIWRNKGDIFKLKNSSGKVMLTYRYGDEKTTTKTSGTKLFFIHHSTGEVYWNGGMHSALENAGYSGDAPWWDGGTDPQDFPGLFQDANNWQNYFNNYDIIVFKSCFPASDITSDEMLTDYKNWYKELYAIYNAHSSKLFVAMSTPPLLEAHTSAAAATRALAFETWLIGDYKTNYESQYSKTNLAPFGLHTLLSDVNGYLKSDFISSSDDNHPNAYSGEVVGPALVEHLNRVLGR